MNNYMIQFVNNGNTATITMKGKNERQAVENFAKLFKFIKPIKIKKL